MSEGGRGGLQIETAKDAAGDPLITLTGELDLLGADPLRHAVAAALDGGASRLAFDLAGLRFIDSAGLAVLLEASSRVGSLELRSPSPAVRRAVELTGLSEVLGLAA